MATPIPAAYLSSTSTFDRDHCAKAIIDYIRGYNILNELPTTTSVTVNRARMLGDIFHSSPVVVDPPVDQFICNLGLHAQCVSTLYQYDTNQPVARPDGTTPSDQYTITSGNNQNQFQARKPPCWRSMMSPRLRLCEAMMTPTRANPIASWPRSLR